MISTAISSINVPNTFMKYAIFAVSKWIMDESRKENNTDFPRDNISLWSNMRKGVVAVNINAENPGFFRVDGKEVEDIRIERDMFVYASDAFYLDNEIDVNSAEFADMAKKLFAGWLFKLMLIKNGEFDPNWADIYSCIPNEIFVKVVSYLEHNCFDESFLQGPISSDRLKEIFNDDVDSEQFGILARFICNTDVSIDACMQVITAWGIVREMLVDYNANVWTEIHRPIYRFFGKCEDFSNNE